LGSAASTFELLWNQHRPSRAPGNTSRSAPQNPSAPSPTASTRARIRRRAQSRSATLAVAVADLADRSHVDGCGLRWRFPRPDSTSLRPVTRTFWKSGSRSPRGQAQGPPYRNASGDLPHSLVGRLAEVRQHSGGLRLPKSAASRRRPGTAADRAVNTATGLAASPVHRPAARRARVGRIRQALRQPARRGRDRRLLRPRRKPTRGHLHRPGRHPSATLCPPVTQRELTGETAHGAGVGSEP
jgi:hypothetical protein